MFDLPVKTRQDKKRYMQFRRILLYEGFTMLQFSVYARYCSSEEASEALRRHVERELPRYGHVRLLSVTDRQFAKMKTFTGKKLCDVEQPPPQLMLF